MTTQTKQIEPTSWRVILRVIAKTLLLFTLCNVVYALLRPIDALGELTLYGTVFPYHERLTLVQEPDLAFEVGIHNIPATLSRHNIARPKAADEFRVVILGDSAARGHGLTDEQTYSGQLSAMNLRSADGRRVVAYNLGLFQNSALKDFLLFDYARQYDIDLVIWFTTLLTIYPERMVNHPLLDHNRDRVRALIVREKLALPLPSEPAFTERTLIGQRLDLAEMLQLQTYGFAQNAITLAARDVQTEDLERFGSRTDWLGLQEGFKLQESDLGFSVIEAVQKYAPVLIVNEPIYVASGRNSALHYNTWYPRWIYDDYRQVIQNYADNHQWHYLDLWDAVPPEYFTNSPFHINVSGAEIVSTRVAEALQPLLAMSE